MANFDYIIVGAGSSGMALAQRLAERTDRRILLLEAGSPRERDFWVQTPIGIAKILKNPDYVWPFQTEPQPELISQQIYWPRGKMPGGSSSVNGMIYVRGEPSEFDHWAELGNSGWGYRDLLPYFKRLESSRLGADTYRGRHGPISVTHLCEDPNRFSDAFIDACQAAGIPKTDDYNGADFEGVGYLQLSTRNGKRCSTAIGYLHGLPHRDNLHLITEAHATGLIFEGNRAVGVRYWKDGQEHQANAAIEVVVSAGPIKSPQLLELSGIGQGKRLQSLGIPVIADVPGVGENLSDHLQSRITFAASQAGTLNEVMASPWRTALMGAKYLLTRKGIMATPAATAHALARLHPSDTRPSVKIQMHHLSGADRYASTKGFGLDSFPGFAIGFFQLRPQSRGHVHATNPDPHQDPRIQPNYLSAEIDRQELIEGFRLSREVARQSALAGLIERETRPGIDIQSDQEVLDYIKKSGQTSWHPIGTCKMGIDAMAVVDPQLKVRGVTHLRVVDSSIMPTMPSSNTNAASIMIGEKAADLILGESA